MNRYSYSAYTSENLRSYYDTNVLSYKYSKSQLNFTAGFANVICKNLTKKTRQSTFKIDHKFIMPAIKQASSDYSNK